MINLILATVVSDPIYDTMGPIARMIYTNMSPEAGGKVLYIIIYVLSAIVYRLGFAQKNSIVKNIIIYALLAVGCTILTLLATLLPMAEVLALSAVFLGLYKLRLYNAKKNEEQ